MEGERMTHEDCVNLLKCMDGSGIALEAIERLERYRDLLRQALPAVEKQAEWYWSAVTLRGEIKEAIQ
jgi:hypothetical protein